jgi:tetratricopeptide (TPR) repeat protein
MTDGVFPDRLTQLRARWEADPASRIFLQLAEEYRHLGRVQDALAVLDKGLEEHPGYLSALVAKGRCHLELADGESARVVLERVVKQDATQMVANKLLVRAYLETGEPVKARERLDLYSLLNDSDPEIEDLRRRIRQLERPAPPEKPPEKQEREAAPFALQPPKERAPAPDVFELDPPAPARRGGDDIFELEPVAPPRVAAAPSASAEFKSDSFPMERLSTPATVPVMVEPAEPEEEPEPMEDENILFPGLSSRDSRRRYLDALGAEGLFSFEPMTTPVPAPARSQTPPPPPAAPPPPISLTAEPFAPGPSPAEIFAPEPAAPAAEEAFWLDEAVAAEPVAEPAPPPEPLMPAIFAPEPPAPVFERQGTTAEELWSEEPAPEPVSAEPEPVPEPPPAGTIATATLGELYFRQGHYAEAERIFREVLAREPGNAPARAGLERLAALGPQPETPRLDARRLLTGYRSDARRPADAELRSRKIFLLSRYLDRLRQGSPHDVS